MRGDPKHEFPARRWQGKILVFAVMLAAGLGTALAMKAVGVLRMSLLLQVIAWAVMGLVIGLTGRLASQLLSPPAKRRKTHPDGIAGAEMGDGPWGEFRRLIREKNLPASAGILAVGLGASLLMRTLGMPAGSKLLGFVAGGALAILILFAGRLAHRLLLRSSKTSPAGPKAKSSEGEIPGSRR